MEESEILEEIKQIGVEGVTSLIANNYSDYEKLCEFLNRTGDLGPVKQIMLLRHQGEMVQEMAMMSLLIGFAEIEAKLERTVG